MTREELQDSLDLWQEREGRFRKNWRSKKKGDPRRFYWFQRLKKAIAMVDRRSRQLDDLGVDSVSEKGLAFVKSFEGFRSRPYQDSVGVWTIGYGETRGVTSRTKPVTEAEAALKLRLRLNRDYLAPVLRAAKAVGLDLDQHEADALASLVYNLGPGILDKGRTMGDALRSKVRGQIANAFLVYDKAGGRALPGLIRRRRAERDMFLKGH